jgi:hypothetical protein
MPKVVSLHDRFINAVAPIAERPFYRFLGQEIIGSGVPHVGLGMNFRDKVDQFYQQAGQEFGSYVATYQFSKLVEHLYDRHISTLSGAEKENALTWKAVGIGMATLPMFAATDYASMYLRNYLTSKTFKTHDFVQLVGLGQEQDTTKKESSAHQKERHQFENQQLQTIGMAVGLALLVGGVGSWFAYRQMKRGAPLPEFLMREFKIPFLKIKTSLHGWLGFNAKNGDLNEAGKMDHLNGGQLCSTFGAFGYSGMILSSRDAVERMEAIIKFAWYGFANVVIPNAVEKRLENKINVMTKGDQKKQSVYRFLSSLGVGAFLYALPPTLTCLLTRKDRAKAFEAQKAAQEQKITPPVTQNRRPQPLSALGVLHA